MGVTMGRGGKGRAGTKDSVCGWGLLAQGENWLSGRQATGGSSRPGSQMDLLLPSPLPSPPSATGGLRQLLATDVGTEVPVYVPTLTLS